MNKTFLLGFLFVLNSAFSTISFATQDYIEEECNKHTKEELLSANSNMLSAYSDPSEKVVALNVIKELQKIIAIGDTYEQIENSSCEKKLSLAITAIKEESDKFIVFLATKYHPDSEFSSGDVKYRNKLSNLDSRKASDYWAHHIDLLSMAYLKLMRVRV
jgi:hypothetical protein